MAGRTHCVDAVIREMRRRFDPLAQACDHDSIFALAYLRTTEEYRRTIEDPTFFSDTPFVNHEDAVFAGLYFDAYDAWHAGRQRPTPPAWAIAFEAARAHAVTAEGNLSLGINAHIQRDLPFALAGIGLVKPDGSSRKPDHDRVNEFLNRVTDDLYAEIARRFDPTIDDANLPGTRRRLRRLPAHPDLARDRVAKRRATRERRHPGGARTSREQHRDVRRLAGGGHPSGRGLPTGAEQLSPRRVLRAQRELTPRPPAVAGTHAAADTRGRRLGRFPP